MYIDASTNLLSVVKKNVFYSQSCDSQHPGAVSTTHKQTALNFPNGKTNPKT